MIDLEKEYKTRNGLKVSNLQFEEDDTEYPIHGIIHNPLTHSTEKWTRYGMYYPYGGAHFYDLIEVEEEEELITQEDYDMVCRENSAFANHLHRMGFTDEQISNIANGGKVND